jgi:hypothetical protein
VAGEGAQVLLAPTQKLDISIVETDRHYSHALQLRSELDKSCVQPYL